jgi:hypothetical protein
MARWPKNNALPLPPANPMQIIQNPQATIAQQVQPVQQAVDKIGSTLGSFYKQKKKPQQEQQARPYQGSFLQEGAPQQPSLDDLTQKYRDIREQGMTAGEALGKKYFGGGLDMQPMVADLMKSYQGQAQQGLSAPQFQAMRQRAAGGLEQQLSEGMRNLQAQQGASGVRGAAAMAQKQNLLQSGQQSRGGLETDLAVQDIGVRERGMAGLQNILAGERMGQLGATMGMGGLYAQDMAAAQQGMLSQQQMEQAQKDLAAAEAKRAPTSYMDKITKGWGQTWDKLGWGKFQGSPLDMRWER